MWCTGCGSGSHPAADASVAIDGTMGCQPTQLLVGGTDVTAQGWSVVMQPPATLTNGADHAKLVTTTSGATGGQLLLNYPGAIEVGTPFKVEIEMLVESVTPHNQFDAGAAILGSFTPPFGAGNDRNQMIYLDAARIGWADDTQSFAVAVMDNRYHRYQLSVDAAGAALVTIDGAQALSRSGFVFNGALAIGDQTNDANVDSVLRIRSVTRLCL